MYICQSSGIEKNELLFEVTYLKLEGYKVLETLRGECEKIRRWCVCVGEDCGERSMGGGYRVGEEYLGGEGVWRSMGGGDGVGEEYTGGEGVRRYCTVL